ncbi:MAG: hypothetical protein HO274_10785 [Ferrovum myxofaciens]|uniref:hypothetical protein n=1 Tax=Ferrovum myxofaciens TaxID=416213 RepID=UPI003B5C50E6|nr:MAG: hypothetical protein HO274_10785 [Ferrovum myxofaciens]
MTNFWVIGESPGSKGIQARLNDKAQHAYTIPLIIKTAQEQGTVPAELDLPRSTVHRLFSRAGLMHKDREAPTDLDRRRFAYAHAGQMWRVMSCTAPPYWSEKDYGARPT